MKTSSVVVGDVLDEGLCAASDDDARGDLVEVGGGEAPGPGPAAAARCGSQSGRARGAPKGRDGAVEAIRGLMVARRSARAERTQTNGQALALILSGPEDLPARFSPA